MGRDGRRHPWALSKKALALLGRRLEELQPKVVLELGSGLSTVVMRRHCENVVSLEHMPKYHAKTKELVGDLPGTLRLARVVERMTPAGELPFYETRVPEDIDFVLIDGPPESIGRAGALFMVWDNLAPGAVIWLDDYRRNGEQRALELWRQHYEFDEVEVCEDVLEIRPKR